MSQVTSLRCDECSKLRVNDSNHWLEVAHLHDPDGFAMTRIGEMEVKDARIDHLCGQECAMKWVARKISEL